MEDLSGRKKLTLLLMLFGICLCTYLLSIQPFFEKLSDSLVLYIVYSLDIVVIAIIISYLKKNNIEVLKFEKVKSSTIAITLVTTAAVAIAVYPMAIIDSEYRNMILVYKMLAPVIIVYFFNVIVSAIAEGLVFRYILLNISKKHKVWPVILSSMLCASINGNAFIGFIIAIYLSIVYLKTKSLWLSILSNIIINGIFYIIF